MPGAAAQAVGQDGDGKPVGFGGVVGVERVEVLRHQEGRAGLGPAGSRGRAGYSPDSGRPSMRVTPIAAQLDDRALALAPGEPAVEARPARAPRSPRAAPRDPAGLPAGNSPSSRRASGTESTTSRRPSPSRSTASRRKVEGMNWVWPKAPAQEPVSRSGRMSPRLDDLHRREELAAEIALAAVR